MLDVYLRSSPALEFVVNFEQPAVDLLVEKHQLGQRCLKFDLIVNIQCLRRHVNLTQTEQSFGTRLGRIQLVQVRFATLNRQFEINS